MVDRLAHKKLQASLGAGQIPLRDSLAQTSDESPRGTRRRAADAADLGHEEALEIYLLRSLLEPFAAQLAAERRPPRLVTRLRALQEQMTEATRQRDFRSLSRSDLSFHLAIARASGHKRLVCAYESSGLAVLCTEAGVAHLLSLPAEATALEHEAIVAAIDERDGEKARQAALLHIQQAIEKASNLERYPRR